MAITLQPPRTTPLLEPDGRTMTLPWFLYLKSLQQALNGLSVTITTAKISTANGSMTFVNGVLTAETQAT